MSLRAASRRCRSPCCPFGLHSSPISSREVCRVVVRRWPRRIGTIPSFSPMRLLSSKLRQRGELRVDLGDGCASSQAPFAMPTAAIGDFANEGYGTRGFRFFVQMVSLIITGMCSRHPSGSGDTEVNSVRSRSRSRGYSVPRAFSP
jgi:hypothetical protein